MAGQVTCNLTINFDSKITSVSLQDSNSSTVTYTSSGQQKEVMLDSYALILITAVLANGYKLNSVTAESGSVKIEDITNNTFKIVCSVATTNATITITSTQEQEKAISLSNLEKFKELCDQTYAKIGEEGLTIITLTGESGTLSEEVLANITSSPEKYVISLNGEIYYYADMTEGDESPDTYTYSHFENHGLTTGLNLLLFYTPKTVTIKSDGTWLFSMGNSFSTSPQIITISDTAMSGKINAYEGITPSSFIIRRGDTYFTLEEYVDTTDEYRYSHYYHLSGRGNINVIGRNSIVVNLSTGNWAYENDEWGIEAENVASTINGKNISDIFEADGVTVKKATGAGYLAKQGKIDNEEAYTGWQKIGIIHYADLIVYQVYSCIMLVNGIFRGSTGSDGNPKSGAIEIEYRKYNNVTPGDTRIGVLFGDLDSNNFCYNILSNFDMEIWMNVTAAESFKATFEIISEQLSNEQNCNIFDFDCVTQSASAPSGAVYAVNRNNAAKVENALTITKDGVSTVYDGSEAKTVEITENGGITVIEIPATDSGKLTSEQLQQVKNNPQNTVLRRTVSPEMNEIYCFDSVNMTQGADSAYTFRNVTSMAQDSLTLQTISVNLGSGLWTYSSVQTSAGGTGCVSLGVMNFTSSGAYYTGDYNRAQIFLIRPTTGDGVYFGLTETDEEGENVYIKPATSFTGQANVYRIG